MRSGLLPYAGELLPHRVTPLLQGYMSLGIRDYHEISSASDYLKLTDSFRTLLGKRINHVIVYDAKWRRLLPVLAGILAHEGPGKA
jgi:hypothetical protein